MPESNRKVRNPSEQPKCDMTYGVSITDACIDWQCYGKNWQVAFEELKSR